MSYYVYKLGQHISAQDYPFYALIQAAMRQADTDNLAKLRAEWPSVFDELQARYHAPGGRLVSDPPEEVSQGGPNAP